MPNENCKLCGASSELQLSHVVPAFAFRWLRATSGNGHLRTALEPNRRIQDGPQLPWLCASCEGVFSRSETAFATKLFHPYNEDPNKRYPYQDWLLHFCCSVSWRTLHYYLEHPKARMDWGPEAMSIVAEAELAWRRFLLGEILHPGRFRQHLLAVDQVVGSTGELPRNINRYLLRAVDIDVVRGGRKGATMFTYTKFGRFIVFGFISDDSGPWEGTRVNANQGMAGRGNCVIPGGIGEYISSKADRMGEAVGGLSERQQKKVDDAFLSNLDEIAGSDLFRALQADVDLFGSDAFLQNPDKPKT